MARCRVKLDLGPHGKVLASVVDYEDAKKVAAGRFDVDPSNVQLFVSDGEDLWELHPSAFQDVVADNGVIVAKSISRTPHSIVVTAATTTTTTSSSSSSSSLSSSTAAPITVSSPVVPKRDLSGDTASRTALPATTGLSTPYSRPARRRSSSASSIDSVETSTSSTTSSSSSSLSSSSSSSSSSDDNRRSESVQDVTATAATTRTVMGPNGLPVSSKERWDPKTHRLMFEKLNEIISSETIFYTRKYTEERYRIFQLLIDSYGDNGVRGNFLRGRTAAALISRVSGVLRTARERGEKIKQPFKFFFPNKKDDEVVSRSATVPAGSAAGVDARASAYPNGGGGRARTLPAPADGPSSRKRNNNANRAAAASASVSASTAPTTSSASASGTATPVIPRMNGKAKQPAKKTGQAPPQIRRSTTNAAATSASPRGAKRPSSGTSGSTAQTKKPKAQQQKGQQQKGQPQRGQPRPSQRPPTAPPPLASTNGRGRSVSPHQDRDDDGRRYSQSIRDRSPRRGWDTWIRARDESSYNGSATELREDGADRARRPTVALPRRPSWTDRVDHQQLDHRSAEPGRQNQSRDANGLEDSLFRADTRSPPPRQTQQSSTPRRGRSASRGLQPEPSSQQSSPRTRRNAVERALEHLVQAGADPSGLADDVGGGSNRRWSGAHRSWRRDQSGDNGWPKRDIDRPRTPPRAD